MGFVGGRWVGLPGEAGLGEALGGLRAILLGAGTGAAGVARRRDRGGQLPRAPWPGCGRPLAGCGGARARPRDARLLPGQVPGCLWGDTRSLSGGSQLSGFQRSGAAVSCRPVLGCPGARGAGRLSEWPGPRAGGVRGATRPSSPFKGLAGVWAPLPKVMPGPEFL